MIYEQQSPQYDQHIHSAANQLYVEVAGETHVFPVVKMTQDEIFLENTEILRTFSRQGLVFKQAVLWLQDYHIAGLDLQLQPDSSHDFVIVAHSHNDATADRLWQVFYEQRHGSVTPPEPDGSVADAPMVPQRGQYTEVARLERLAFMRQQTGAALEQVGETALEAPELQGNLEAYIGSVEVPVGIAGPLRIQGQDAQGVFYAPIATTEGALISSITRGARALTRSGGVTTHIFAQRMMRVPVFTFANMHAALFFAAWLQDHFDEIKAKTQEYSRFANLIELEPQVQGKSVHVHFVYETGDAAGQNMTTTCTWNTCLWILERMHVFKQIEIENFIIEANLSGDKKVTYQSFIKGRGIRVQAEAFLPEPMVKRMLKVTSKQLFASYQTFIEGSLQAGMVGFNINVANFIAGIFTATGQDIACVHESSTAHLHIEITETGIYACMTLPSLVIGTVGGGTGLPQQRECLEILGCAGAGHGRKLAEIIVAYCLALDLSTLAAVAGGQFAVSHERLGRNRPVRYLSYADMQPDFFNEVIFQTLQDETTTISAAVPVANVPMGSSIITELSGQGDDKVIGHFPYRMTLESPEYFPRTLDVIVKSKPTDREVIQMLGNLAALGGADLARALKRYIGRSEFAGCHGRELAIYAQKETRLRRYVPEVYGVYHQDVREIYLLILERLQDMELMDSADDVSGWTSAHIYTALDGLADLHSIWLEREEHLKQQPWLGHYPTAARMHAASDLWELLAVQMHQEFPEWFRDNDLALLRHTIKELPQWWPAFESMPKTLIHNDFNPRNIAFRKTTEGLRLCVYDWELATLHVPQHDLAELLVFVLDDQAQLADVQRYVTYYQQALEDASGRKLDAVLWWQGFYASLQDLLVNRVAMYGMAHSAKHYGFMERVFATLRHLLDMCPTSS